MRVKGFSKPGRYSKWLIKQYLRNNLQLKNEDYTKRLNYFLFICSTGWFKFNYKYFDILQYDSFKFMYFMEKTSEIYERVTIKSKYDVIYSDEKIDILVPLNFTAAYETSMNTDWCTQKLSGYSLWNNIAILYRIIPKIKNFDKLKLTWLKKNNEYFNEWSLACSRYPEISGNDSPFELIEGKENWEHNLHNDNKVYDVIRKSMELLSDKAKQAIISNHAKYK